MKTCLPALSRNQKQTGYSIVKRIWNVHIDLESKFFCSESIILFEEFGYIYIHIRQFWLPVLDSMMSFCDLEFLTPKRTKKVSADKFEKANTKQRNVFCPKFLEITLPFSNPHEKKHWIITQRFVLIFKWCYSLVTRKKSIHEHIGGNWA